jgi:8-oxo-dGTP pyrophosphatase MutT (NUDIX family)
LVPIYDGPEGPTLLMIRRTHTINHPGQVAFPGGRPEPGDASLRDTALREAQEELGIDPAAVRIVGELPLVETLTSNYAISAFVGHLGPRPVLRPQPAEVDAILEVPIDALRQAHLPVEEEWEFPLVADRTPTSVLYRRLVRLYPWDEDKIWGATARMLETLLSALADGSVSL